MEISRQFSFFEKRKIRGLFSSKNERKTKKVYKYIKSIFCHFSESFWLLLLAFKERFQEDYIIQSGITHSCSSLVQQPTRSAEHSLNSHTCRGISYSALSEKSAFLSNFCRHIFCRQNDKSKNLLSTNNVRQIEALAGICSDCSILFFLTLSLQTGSLEFRDGTRIH